MASRQGQGFILRATFHAFPRTHLRHSLPSWTILITCLISKPLFFKYSFTVPIHHFRGLPTHQYTLLHRHSWQSYPSIYPIYILYILYSRTTEARLYQSFHLDPSSLRITMHSGIYPSSFTITKTYKKNS